MGWARKTGEVVGPEEPVPPGGQLETLPMASQPLGWGGNPKRGNGMNQGKSKLREEEERK